MEEPVVQRIGNVLIPWGDSLHRRQRTPVLAARCVQSGTDLRVP